MAYEVYVIMSKRKDGIVYADMHKTTEKFYFNFEDAEKDRLQDEVLTNHFHTVKIICMTEKEYDDNDIVEVYASQ